MIDLSIGNPDMPPADFVREEMVHTANQKESYGYTLSGIQEFHEAVTEYYNNTHNVILNADKEVLLLMVTGRTRSFTYGLCESGRYYISS